MVVLASVSELAVTAIKGFALQHPSSVELTAGGAVGDREFLVVDEHDELYSVIRTGVFLPYWSTFDPTSEVLAVGRGDRTELAGVALPGEPVRVHLFGDRYVEGHRVPGPWDALLSELAGSPVRLVRSQEPSGAYDVHPVTLQSRASVAALGTDADGSPLDPRRFRMLITCDGPAFGEDTWSGTELTVGTAVLRVGGPVPRCAAVQRHPDDPDQKVAALRRIHELRGRQPSELGQTLNLGVYASVVRPGTVSVGSAVLPGDQPE